MERPRSLRKGGGVNRGATARVTECLASHKGRTKGGHGLERAAQLQPMNPYAWYNLGMAHAALGDRDKLAETHAHLDRFDPKMALKLARDAGLEVG